MAALCLCLAPAARAEDASWQAAPYTLGQGLYFPHQGLRLGGYADLQYYDVKKDRNTYSVRDISLFFTKDLGTRWQLFAEVAAGNALDNGGRHAKSEDADLHIERLYADYHVNTGISIRIGKFLTPIGEWNLVHADPLTWTVSRPLTTSASFARHAAGAMVYGTVSVRGKDLDYWVYADDSTDLGVGLDDDRAYSSFGADNTARNRFRHALGGRVLYHLLGDRLGIGASYVNYTLTTPRQNYRLTGVDFSWSSRYVDLTGEGIYRHSDGSYRPAERGGFLQAEVPLLQHLYLIGRYERYRSSGPATMTTLRTLGINYRPIPGIVLKLERRDGNRNLSLAPAGFLASIAVLF